MNAVRVLMPYNFTNHEFKALHFVQNTFGLRKNAKITFFHCFTPLPKIDPASDPLLSKLRSGMHFLEEELRKKETGLIAAKEYLLAHNFAPDQVDYIFKKRERSIAEEIAATVSEGKYGVLVLTPTPGKVRRLFAQSVHDRALRGLDDVTVCLVL